MSLTNSSFFINNGVGYKTGDNSKGQLGVGNNTNSSSYQSPSSISGFTNIKQIATGLAHTILVLDDGTVYSSGDNSYGQLGLGNTTNTYYTFTLIPTLSNVKEVFCGAYHTVFILNDNTAYVCGRNDYGQLGTGDTTNVSTPTLVSFSSNIITAGCGTYHTIFVTGDKVAYGCGNSTTGELGLGDTTSALLPVSISGISNIKQVACGSNHTVFVLESGDVYTCGYNNVGQLGDGTNSTSKTPKKISLTNVKFAACGSTHTLFLLNTNTVYGTGENSLGELGISDTSDTSTPTKINIDTTNISQIACGSYHSIILMSDNSVRTFGRNNVGQLGTIADTVAHATPSTILSQMTLLQDNEVATDVDPGDDGGDDNTGGDIPTSLSNTMVGQATIITQSNNDQSAMIAVATTNDQPAKITSLGNGNHMYGTVQIIPPPLSKLIALPMYDTYTRADMPTLSYGNSEVMYTGKVHTYSGEEIDSKAFIYFDLKTYLDPTIDIVKTASLRLSCVDKTASFITLYSVDKKWQENGTTWNNQPNAVSIITSKTIKSTDSYIDIDLSDYIKNSFANGTDNGIYISLTDPTGQAKGFYTKEAKKDELKPQLTVEYYDLNDQVQNSDVPATMKIIRRENNDQNAKIKVYTNYTTTSDDKEAIISVSKPDQPAKISVLRNNDQEAEISIFYNGLVDQDSTITPYRVEPDDKESVINIVDHLTKSNDQSANILISNPLQRSSITITDKITKPNDKIADIKVINKVDSNEDQNAEISVYKKNNTDQSANIKILHNTDTDAKIDVITKINNDQEATVIISKPYQPAKIDIIDHKDISNDINSTILPYRKENADQDADIDVISKRIAYNDQRSKITINQRIETDQLANITVANTTDQDAKIVVSKPDQPATITIVDIKNGDNDQSANISISNFLPNDQEANITIIDSKDGNNDQSANISINNHFPIDQPAKIKINKRTINEIDGKINITDERFEGYVTIIHR